MADLLIVVRGLPRVRLAHLPTPMEPMPRLASALGLSSLWVKRDDCTGLGVGGNKIRKLEFDLAAALAELKLPHDELEAIERALRLEPRHLAALLQKGAFIAATAVEYRASGRRGLRKAGA